MKRQGFTLMELLIVIAIIATLAAVLIPNVINARTRAINLAARLYLKQTVQWIASADTGGTIGTSAGKVNLSGDDCRNAALQNEGAPSSYPISVSSCSINFDIAANQYKITVTSQSNQSYVATYWLR